MKRLSCKCGCSKFDAEKGAKHWYIHELRCRNCGEVYGLPSIFVDNIERTEMSEKSLGYGG